MRRDQLRKLLEMSRSELGARSRALVNRWREEGSYRLGLARDPDVDVTPEARHADFTGPWIDRREERAVVDQLRTNHKGYVDEIIKAADAIRRHEFTLFGTVFRCGDIVAWQADPLSGHPWPSDFHTRVRIFDGNNSHGDVKYVWELNRHQFLPLLGKAYRLTGDEAYAWAGLALINSWIDTNPVGVGINWTSALEVAIRSLSWCWTCALFEGSASLTPARRRRILGSLSEHGRYLEKHLSFYFSPYNHLIGEATALFVMGNLLPWLRPAARWRDRGWAILEKEMPKQYHADGGSVEQATGYHHFTLGFHLQALLVRRRMGTKTGPQMWSGLEKAIEFSMHMMRPDGSMPMIGDGDEGKATALLQPDLWDFRVFLALGAVLFDRGDFKKMGGSLPPDAAWLVGTSGWLAHDAVDEEVPRDTSKALPHSGYYVMRSGWDAEAHYLTFDCGEIAAGVSTQETPSAAHGHADTLSIEVSAFGKPFLVDPGFCTYNGDLDWHRYFRETEAHNTVVVDGRSQAEFRGRLKWSHAPRVEAHEWITLGALDYAEGSHFGYQRLKAPVVHRRSVVFLKPSYWIVRDELLGEGTHALDRCFHFATADVIADKSSTCVQTRLPDGLNLALLSVETDGVAVELTRGGPLPASGWLGVGYERRVQAAVAKYRSTSRLPCVFHTLLMPFRGNSPSVHVSARPIESDTTSPADRSFEVVWPGGRDVWAFSSGRIVRFGDDYVTDARSICVQLDDEGHVRNVAFVSGSKIEIKGEPMLSLDRRVRAATLSVANGHRVLELSEPARVLAPTPAPSTVEAPEARVRTRPPREQAANTAA